MASFETKVIQVSNSTSVIDGINWKNGSFGWNVLGVQITHSQDNRIYQDPVNVMTGSITIESKTVDYATITYQRDMGMTNYDEIVALESEYDAVEEEINLLRNELYGNAGCLKELILIMIWPIGLAYLLLFKKEKDKEKAGKQKQIEQFNNRLEEIVSEARQLL